MAVSFNVPAAPKKSVMKIDTFLGADFTNSPANADDNKSPNLINMIRDVPGKIRKCMGYETVQSYTDYGIAFDDVISVSENIRQTYLDEAIIVLFKKNTIGFQFASEITTTITINNGKDIFNQDILSEYHTTFGNNNVIEYVRANEDLPTWLDSIRIDPYTEEGETYYTLALSIVNGSASGNISNLKLKFIDTEILTNGTQTLVKAGADSSGSPYIWYVKDADGKLKFYLNPNYDTTKTSTIIFPLAWLYPDDETDGTRLSKWLSYYKDPDWESTNFVDGQTTYTAIAGTVDLKDKIISDDIDKSIFNFIYVCFGRLDGNFPAYEIVMRVTTNKDENTAQFMTMRLLENPKELDGEETDESGDIQINGFHKLRSDDVGLVHSGTRLFRGKTLLYDGANNHRSMSWEFDEHLYIVDGKRFLRYGLNSPTSDIKYASDKPNNNVVINQEVGIVVQRYNEKNYSLELTDTQTTSDNGRFEVSADNSTITYYDTLTEVGQDVSYSCQWTYKKKRTSSAVSGSMTTHHLIGISDVPEYEVIPVESIALVPLITISKDPDGGGTAYNDLNLLTPGFTERFLPKQNTDPVTGEPTTWMKDYHMSFDNLDEVEPIVKKLNDSTGEWETLTLGTDYTIDYEAGVVTFTTAPSYTGEDAHDRISITAYRTVERYQGMINKCTIGTLFGVGGANDRLFLSGNPDFVNYDWHSGAYQLPTEEQEDPDFKYKTDYASPTYFPDGGYATLGSSGSAIVGYSRVSNYLAAHKDKFERDQNIIVREGDLVESEASFRIINTLQGAGAVAPYSFGYLQTEPLFLTDQGIYAVTAQDITGEKYAQNRSYFLDGKLLEEEDLSQAYGYVYNDLYWLCLNNVAYILDGLQPLQTDKSKPYSTRQYAGFYRTNLPAYTMWEDNGRLFFGTKDGRVCRFYKDKYDLKSYNDDGEVIECTWETPDITGQVFFKNKTLRDIAIKLDTATAASVNIYVMDRGIWRFIRTDHWRARIFQFSTIVFSKFTFNCDKTQRTFLTKFRVKKVDKFRLRLTNDQLNESFALSDVGFEYVEKGNYTR